MAKRTLLSWSSGKDSAFTLYLLQGTPGVEVAGLFTTVNVTHGRVAMHAVRSDLLELQASATGLPLRKLEIPYPCSNEHYERVMSNFLDEAKAEGIECMAFGDLFLEDVRKYREEKLAQAGIRALFPLWKMESHRLADQLIRKDFQMIVTCLDPKHLPCNFAGRKFDEQFLKDLPRGVDPCGENGEFHTFVYGGPILKKQLNVKVGKIVERDGFIFADIDMEGA